jgi:hypothetical protein
LIFSPLSFLGVFYMLYRTGIGSDVQYRNIVMLILVPFLLIELFSPLIPKLAPKGTYYQGESVPIERTDQVNIRAQENDGVLSFSGTLLSNQSALIKLDDARTLYLLPHEKENGWYIRIVSDGDDINDNLNSIIPFDTYLFDSTHPNYYSFQGPSIGSWTTYVPALKGALKNHTEEPKRIVFPYFLNRSDFINWKTSQTRDRILSSSKLGLGVIVVDSIEAEDVSCDYSYESHQCTTHHPKKIKFRGELNEYPQLLRPSSVITNHELKNLIIALTYPQRKMVNTEGQKIAHGDLDGDGTEETVVLTAHSPTPLEIFVWRAAQPILITKGTLKSSEYTKNTAETFLGMDITDRRIRVQLINDGCYQGEVCDESGKLVGAQPVTLEFQIVGSQLQPQ